MSRRSNVYEVLIASPSDVVEERRVLAEVVEDWNSANSRARGISLQVRRWELDGVPASGERPQEMINKQLVRDADILLGVFGARLGTPTGKAESGTVEEINHFRSQGKPVLLYFSEASIPIGTVDSEQLKLLREYKDSLKGDTLYHTFRDVGDLRSTVTRDLANLMNQLAANAMTSVEAHDLRESRFRADAAHVSARITASYSDTLEVTLKNESNEAVRAVDVRLSSKDGHPLTELHRIDGKMIEPGKSLPVNWKPTTNPADTLISLNSQWGALPTNAQTVPVDIVIEVGFEILGIFKRCPTKRHVQVDRWNHRIDDHVWV